MSELIYFCSQSSGAPSEVSRNILRSLSFKEKCLNLKIFFPNNRKIYCSKEEIISSLSCKFLEIKLNDLFFKQEPDTIIHFSQSPLIFPNRKFLLYFISVIKKYKKIINYHGEPSIEYHLKLKRRDIIGSLIYSFNYLVTPFVIQNADTIVVNSFMMKSIFQEKYNPKKIVVIPNGLDDFWFQNLNLEKPLLLDQKSFSFFYHGRLAPEKGVNLLLISFAKLLNEHPNTILYIAGDGPDLNLLIKTCANLKIQNNVFFLHNIPKLVVKSYLAFCDAAIYPSIHDAFSLAVLEALKVSNGPVLFSNKVGLHDFVKASEYHFCTFNPDIESIYDSMKMTIENRYPPLLVIEQKRFANQFKWEIICNQYIEIYSKL